MNQQEILAALADQLDQQSMELTVLRSAYVLLARQLDRCGALPIADLQADLRTMAAAQPDEGWQAGHEEIAAALQQARAAGASRTRAFRLRHGKGL